MDLRDAIPHGTSLTSEYDLVGKLCYIIAETLGHGDLFLAWWSQREDVRRSGLKTSSTLFKEFLHAVVLTLPDERIVIVLDEIDRLSAFGRTWEFFLDVSYDIVNREEFSRIHLVAAGLNRPIDLARDGDIAKYQHFRHFRLTDFSPHDAHVIYEFAQGLVHVADETQRLALSTCVLLATHGQPFLTQYYLQKVLEHRLESKAEVREMIMSLASSWRRGNSEGQDIRPVHFDQPEKILGEFRDDMLPALDAYRDILDNRAVGQLPPPIRTLLLGSGLAVDEDGQWRTRNSIYELVFDHDWVGRVRERLLIRQPSRKRGKSAGSALPRVLVLNIGGTLGMQVDDDGNMVEPDDAAHFLRQVPQITDIIYPLVEAPLKRPTDGANITPRNWVALAETIYSYRSRDIRGVLIVAGTDTLAYAASAVAFALGQGLRFPVVFTGAQAPVTKLHGDAIANILRAAFVASVGRKLPEVVVAFNDVVLRAVRTEKVDDFRFAAFDAPSQGPLAVVGETLQFQLPIRPVSRNDPLVLSPQFEERILKISQYPGLNVDYIITNLKSGKVKGLMIESLGLGNLPVVPGYSLLPAIEMAGEMGIPVLISGRYPIQPEFIRFYKPASLPLKLGAISAGDMAPPAALTKFMWAIGKTDAEILRGDLSPSRRLEEIRNIMETDLLGEIGIKASADGEE